MNTSMGDFKLATAEWAHSVFKYLREAGEMVSRESLRNRRRAGGFYRAAARSDFTPHTIRQRGDDP